MGKLLFWLGMEALLLLKKVQLFLEKFSYVIYRNHYAISQFRSEGNECQFSPGEPLV